mmetsp:Transcript_9858/g.16421  ORF Transcript_9858/g.16421 Transcript_9858/m.16421 type:complete len:237 (+) Transcript_9858:18-728(+)
MGTVFTFNFLILLQLLPIFGAFQLGAVAWKPTGRALGVEQGHYASSFMQISTEECVIFSALAQRRSVAKYDSSRKVPSSIVQSALQAAILAPNHFLTEPWRFYQCGSTTRDVLCTLNEEKRAMFEGVPGWIVVTVATEYDEMGLISTKQGLEDHAAVACAIQNMMLSFSSDGVGSKWMTGALGIPPEKILDAVGADATSERFMGAIWFGYPEKPLDPEGRMPPRKLGIKGVLKTLP